MDDELVVVTDARGVGTLQPRSLVMAMAAERVDRILALEARAADWGGEPSDDDTRQGLIVLAEAQGLLESAGEWQPDAGPVSLSRFYQPGESEQELVARAEAEERRRAVARRMAGTALLVDQLSAEDDIVHDANNIRDVGEIAATAENSPPGADDPHSSDGLTNGVRKNRNFADFAKPPERVNLKRHIDDHGLEWWDVSGRGEFKRYAEYATADREARRRVGRA